MKRSVKNIIVSALLISLVSSVPSFAGEYTKTDADAVIDGLSLEKNGIERVIIDGEMYVPLRKTFELLEKEVLWQSAFNAAFVNDSKYPSNSQYSKESDYRLIVSVPHESIYVYGLKPKGVVLQFKNNYSYIDTEYITDEEALPEMAYGDLDGDGLNDIVISFNTESGTDVSVDTLHILKTIGYEPHTYTDFVFDNENIINYFNENIAIEAGEDYAIVYYGENEKTFDLDINEKGKINEFYFGKNIDFDVTKTCISFKAPIGISCEKGIVYFALLKGEIVFNGEDFEIKNTDIISLDEQKELDALAKEAKELLMRDLEIEGIFNGGLQGDSDYNYKCYQEYEKTGQIYFPVVSDKYKTVDDLKNLLESTYSSEEKINYFLENYIYSTEFDTLFKDLGGKLYVNMLVGGKGMPIILDENSVRVKKISDTNVEIIFDFDMFDYKTYPSVTSMTLVDGKWLLDKGVYETAKTD